jgi:hypothetical protein
MKLSQLLRMSRPSYPVPWLLRPALTTTTTTTIEKTSPQNKNIVEKVIMIVSYDKNKLYLNVTNYVLAE